MNTTRIFYTARSKAIKSIAVCFFIICPQLALQAQPFAGSGGGSSPFQEPGGIGWSSTPSGDLPAGVAYSPFSPFSPSSSSSPVLYGPGGNPIGGLPISSGHWLLLGLVLMYAGWRFFKRRQVDKKAYLIPIL